MATLSSDEIDDILYFTRTNSLTELDETLSELSTKYNLSISQILALSVDPETQNTPLHYASANNHAELLAHLLNLLQPTTTSLDQTTHVESQSQQQEQPQPSTSPLPAHLVNPLNSAGNTPLHWASYNGHIATVKLLLAAGADMWIKNAAGHLALFEAERAERGEVVQVLLEAGGAAVEEGVGRSSTAVGADADVNGEVDGEGEAEEVRMAMGDVGVNGGGVDVEHQEI